MAGLDGHAPAGLGTVSHGAFRLLARSVLGSPFLGLRIMDGEGQRISLIGRVVGGRATRLLIRRERQVGDLTRLCPHASSWIAWSMQG